MKIRRHVKCLALYVSWRAIFSRIMRWQVSLKFHFSPWTIYIRGFSVICVGSFDYQGIYLNASGILAFVEPIASNFHQNGYSGGGQVGVRYQFYNTWFLGAEFSAMGNSERPIQRSLFFHL